MRKVGYIRPEKGVSEASQRKLLEAAGVPDSLTYVESTKPGDDLPARQKMFDGLRKGDQVVVPWLHRLARGRDDLREATSCIVKAGCTILEAASGVASTDTRWTCRSMDAADWWTGDLRRLSKRKREERASAGGIAKAKKYGPNRQTKAEARRIWFDHDGYQTDQIAAEAIGRSKRTLHNWFGPSRRPAGNPETRKR